MSTLPDPDLAEIKAAGGVVWRREPGGPPHVAVAHRPGYDDWSLPKGKLDPGESWEQAALREIHEEIGLRCRLGAELPAAHYRDRGRSKAVRYWLMEPVELVPFTPNDEVDELRWLTVEDATALLSYPHDRELVAEAARRLG